MEGSRDYWRPYSLRSAMPTTNILLAGGMLVRTRASEEEVADKVWQANTAGGAFTLADVPGRIYPQHVMRIYPDA